MTCKSRNEGRNVCCKFGPITSRFKYTVFARYKDCLPLSTVNLTAVMYYFILISDAINLTVCSAPFLTKTLLQDVCPSDSLAQCNNTEESLQTRYRLKYCQGQIDDYRFRAAVRQLL